MNRLAVNICNMQLKNPIIAASGTFGFGREYADFIDLNRLGGISVKALTLEPRKGNPAPRIAETPAGILNSVGLQNPGIDEFIKTELPFIKQYKTSVIVNIAGNTVEDYAELAKRLQGTDIDALEVNVSCPNVKEGCVTFGVSTKGIAMVTEAVKKYSNKPVIIKLTPNVTSIASLAKACEDAGADAVSLINTLLGMAIDIQSRRPILKNNFGGLSGPAIKPIALRMVYEVAQTVNIPVIGMGGISSWQDVIEFMLAGASAVNVGTSNFINPMICEEIITELENYMNKHNIESIQNIVGTLQLNERV